MPDKQVFSLGGDSTMLVAPGSNEDFKRRQELEMLLLKAGLAKKIITLEGGSQDRRERAEDFIALYISHGIPARRLGGYAVEIGAHMPPKQTLAVLKNALEAKGLSGKLMTPEQYKAMVAAKNKAPDQR